IDGGVTNPVPLEPLAPVESDLLLAVSLTGRRTGMRVTAHEGADPEENAGDAESRHSRKGASGMIRRAGKLTGRIRTAAADVRDAELVRFIAARWGQGGAEGIAGGDDDGDVVLDPGDGAGAAVTESADPSEEVEEAVAKGEQDVESDDHGDES